MARQLDPLTSAVDRLERPDVERQFRVQARRAKQALARLAQDEGLEWSFEIARGSVASEIQAAATNGDLVSLGRVGWSFRHRRLLGRTARALLAQTGRCILLIERLGERPSPVAVLYDGSDQANHALDIAERLARSESDRLAILVVGRDQRGLRERLVERLGEERAKVAAIELGEVVDARLSRIVRSMNAGLLVIPVGIGSLDEAQIQDLLNDTDSPILAVS